MSNLSLPTEMEVMLRQSCQTRLEAMRSVRLSWWTHWSQLANVYLPRRYKWFVTPNTYNRGVPINQMIKDETGVLAARTLASGMLSGLTSPTKPWFRLGIEGIPDMGPGSVKSWLFTCTQIMTRIYAGSNFYQALGQHYHDLGVFGSAALIQYEDVKDVIRFYGPMLGEFFFSLSNRLDVDTLAREYTYTVREEVQEFGIENVSVSTRQAYKSGGAQLEQEVVMGHIIMPNVPFQYQTKDFGYIVPKMFKYVEIYWESTAAGAGSSTQGTGSICRIKGYRECPFTGGRWDVASNDPYGRSPGMDGLPANLQLQIEQSRKAEAIEKMVRPPMVGAVSMKNEPASILPGEITYVADMSQAGFKPAFMVEPRIQEMGEDIKEVQLRLESVFFVPLFTMISSLDTVRTATEIDARREEKLILLGPVIERFENEVLDPLIKRTFAIAMRRGLLPPMPPELKGMQISVQYISMLAEAQRAAATAAIERLVQFSAGLVAVSPEALDNINLDRVIQEYADLLAVDPQLLRSIKEIMQIRQARNQAQATAAALQTGQAAATAAQTLSQTDVGGGRNALQMMTSPQ